MLGLPASDKAPALAATSGRAVAQLKTPWGSMKNAKNERIVTDSSDITPAVTIWPSTQQKKMSQWVEAKTIIAVDNDL